MQKYAKNKKPSIIISIKRGKMQGCSNASFKAKVVCRIAKKSLIKDTVRVKIFGVCL